MKFKLFTILYIFAVIGIIAFALFTRGTTIKNPISNMTATAFNEVIPYETDYVYNEKMPSTADPILISEGVNGLSFTYDGLNYKVISEVKNEVVLKGTGKEGEFTGKLTGYGPDCPGCSLVGNVSCETREGKRHSLINDGIYYTDKDFGELRILAADNSLFPCGTIIKVNNGIMKEFYGIVLDTGYTMRNALKSGIVWLDLAFKTEAETESAGVTSSNTKFSVQRWGW